MHKNVDTTTDEATTTPPLNRTSVGEAFLAVAERRAETTALRWDLDTAPQTLTYGELARRARILADRLRGDLVPGDRLAIWSGNNPEWIVAQLAAALAGVVLVPMNPALTVSEAGYIIASSEARALLAGPTWRGRDLLASASTLAPDLTVHPLVDWADVDDDAVPPAGSGSVSPEDRLMIQYTSGTTGTPKGAVLSHLVGSNVGPLSHAALGLTEEDIVCSPLPFHHVGGSVCTVLAALLRGATYIVLPGFDVQQTLTTLQRGGVTFFGGVPTMMLALLEHVAKATPQLPELRMAMVGGSTVSPSLITTIEQAFDIEVANGYGQSEAPSSLQTRPGDTADVKAETVGRANFHREVAILDPTGARVPVGTVGELCVRGELVMDGYWGHDRSATSGTTNEAGWLHTGDLATQDATGVVTLRGRIRDVIIRGGENIYPAEVEAVMVTHPEVAEIAVVGAQDPRWGEIPVAFVRAAGDTFDPDALETFARSRLAGFKVPRTWRRVSEFPLTASGKVQKFKLSELFHGGPAGPDRP